MNKRGAAIEKCCLCSTGEREAKDKRRRDDAVVDEGI